MSNATNAKTMLLKGALGSSLLLKTKCEQEEKIQCVEIILKNQTNQNIPGPEF